MSGDPLTFLSRDQATMEAIDGGLEIVIADDKMLQLDLDSDEDLDRAVAGLDFLTTGDLLDVSGYEPWFSRNGNVHLTVHLSTPMDVKERILLQACLGSDRKRELFSWCRVVLGLPDPVLLFKPKEEEK